MKQIKFRAWDKERKTMVFIEGVFNRCPDGVEDLSEIMQYTGVKDNHDKEIYEGDILKIEAKNLNVKIVEDAYACFRKGVFGVKMDESMFLSFSTLWDAKIEVVGNIWEALEKHEKHQNCCNYCKSIDKATPASPKKKYNYCPMCGRRRQI
jgi:hypothetical protein